MNYYLRTIDNIIEELSWMVSDFEEDRWPEVAKRRAVNMGIYEWADRVRVPYIYSLPSGYSHSSFSVVIPDYIDPRYMVPQIKSSALDSSLDFGDNVLDTWVNVKGWTWEPDGTGNNYLRLNTLPYSEDGRIIFYKEPQSVPIHSTTLSTTSLASTDTEMSVSTSDVTVPKVGYVFFNGEWIQYAGISRGSSVVTLQNLVRGVYDTSAQPGSSGDKVTWGVVTDREGLWNHLLHYAASILHQTVLSDASPVNREQHQWNTRYFGQKADEIWLRYMPGYNPKVHISTWHIQTALDNR